MKQILVISTVVLFIVAGYICYDKYQKNIEIAYYLGGVEERATSFSLMILSKKDKTNDFNKYIKSMITFDLKVLNENEDIKSGINLKRYCEAIIYIKNDFNTSTEKLINQLCMGVKGSVATLKSNKK